MFFDLLKKIRILLTPGDKAKLMLVTLLVTAGVMLELLGIGTLLPAVAVIADPELLNRYETLGLLRRILPCRDDTSFMLCCCGLVMACYIVKNLFSLGICHIQASFIYSKQRDFSDRMYRSYLGAPYAWHLNHTAAELNNRLSRIPAVCSYVLLPLMTILADLFNVAVLASLAVFFMPDIVLAGFAAALLAGAAVYIFFHRANAAGGRQALAADMDAAEIRMSGLNGIKEVKLYGVSGFFAGRHADAMHRLSGKSAMLYVLGQLPRHFLDTASIVTALVILAVMLLSGIPRGTIILTFGMLVAILSRTMPPVSRMHYNLTMIKQHKPVFDDLYNAVAGIEPDAQTATEADNNPFTLENALEVRNLSFAYDAASPVLQNLSFVIKSGQAAAVTGATGCGKTTLADLVCGLLKPEQGGIFSDGRNINENIRQWQRLPACVPQYIYLVSGTIRSNVAWGIPGSLIDDARVWQALETAQLAGFVRALPLGLDAPVAENGANLSGGQRQRLGIARAMYKAPELLILDEATSALDADTEAAFADALETLHGKVTMLIITHRTETASRCDINIKLG